MHRERVSSSGVARSSSRIRAAGGTETSRALRLWGAALASVFLSGSTHAAFVAPAGYQTTNLGITGDGIGVSSTGRLAVATGSTINLYDTYNNGRTLIGTVTDKTDWSFLTDIQFVNNNTIVFGENGKSQTLFSVDFSTATPAVSKLAPNNSFPAIQGVALTADHANALITGTAAPFGSGGGLYLDQFNLGSSTITPIATNTGSGFVGGAGVTPAGQGVLLDSGTTAGIVHVYNLGTHAETDTLSLAGGSGNGAYALAFDSARNAYVTSGNTISEILGIDTTSPTVFSFGAFSEGAAGFPFPTSIAFTGGGFGPASGGSGALIVNGDFTSEGSLFAITPTATTVPLPAGVFPGMLLIGGLLIGRGFWIRRGSVLGALALAALSPTARAGVFYADKIVAYTPGSAQSSAFSDPAAVFDSTINTLGPRGGGTATQNTTHVYNLGVGNAAGTTGTITVGFQPASGRERAVRNLAGKDFTVFENPIYAGEDSHASFAELMKVSVSSDGTHFATFPILSLTAGTVAPEGTIDPSDVSGFAGVHPVLANVDANSISPFDPTVSGGDAFDLADLTNDAAVLNGTVDLGNIRFIRLADVLGDGTLLDSSGHKIFDPTGGANNGADVDAIAIINGVTVPEPTGLLPMTLGAIGLLARRR